MLTFFNDFQTLLTAAEAYYHLGYAVIPLLGDLNPSRPKVAARPWSAYQSRPATLTEMREWFSPTGNAAALGIVTGRVSHLVVLDFDSADCFADFRRSFPDLIETRTVQSAGRALPHLYFHLPSHLHLPSHKRPGVDLLSDGRYVVAPPTTINGQPYRITRGGMPRPLTQHDITRLQSFLTATSINGSIQRLISNVPTLTPSPVYGLSANEPAKIAAEGFGKRAHLSRADLHALYYYWLSRGGRNDALFRTAIYARDHGWDQTQTRHALTTLHVTRAASPNTAAENHALRQREAYATIRSAFSRPPRLNTPTLSASVPISTQTLHRGMLPNAIREALLQRKLTYVLRTLEGLLLSGFRPDQSFTAEQAIGTLKSIVGRDSIYNALNALAPTGQPFFPLHSPSALPPASKEAAIGTTRLKTKKCFFVTEKKSGIIKKGPKHRRFKMPAIRTLYKLLGVKPSGSDPLTREDLTTASQTRMALHRELIKRRPAEYSRRWLANRIGVTRRTLDTYNHLIPIHSQPTYHEKPLSWENINTLPDDQALAGAHIETLSGKKYPALRAVAAHLLAKNAYIRLKTRASNYYWYGTETPPTHIRPVPYPTFATPPINMLSPLSIPHTSPATLPASVLSSGHHFPQTPAFSIAMAKKGWGDKGELLNPTASLFKEEVPSPRRFRAPLPDSQQESLAQTIYTRVNQRTGDTNRHLSLANARRLVLNHPLAHINAALYRLQQRPDLANPTGFFITVLRSNARSGQT